MERKPLHIVSISDMHGRLKNTYIPPCDVVTISGDFSALRSDRQIQYGGQLCNWITNKFIPWLVSLPCKRVVITPGNHDFITEQPWFEQWFSEKLQALDDYYLGASENPCKPSEKIVYLCYTKYTYEGYTFYGCPTSDIHGWAWSANDDYTKYLVPEGVDIMLVHQAPDWMDLGTSYRKFYGSTNYGSQMLLNALNERPENLPKLLLCGHIHTGNHKPIIYDVPYGDDKKSIMLANVSTKDEDYKEYFYARNFEIIDLGDGSVVIDTWVSPAEGPREIEEHNNKESFII